MEMPSPGEGGGLLIGAAAGPFWELGVNAELVPNLAWGAAAAGGDGEEEEDGVKVRNRTRYAKVRTDDGGVLCERIGAASTGFGLMGNLLGCRGEAGPVLHVSARGRTGAANFTAAMQAAIEAVYGAKLVSLGGVFVVRTGRVKMHVMPDFPDGPFEGGGVEDWLRFYDMDAPVVCLSVLHAGDDGGLELRREHTHCFGVEGTETGGHYHFDLDETREVVEYEGWLNVAEVLYRIDPAGSRS